MSVFQWNYLPDRDVLDWLLDLQGLLRKLILSKMQRKKAAKEGKVPRSKGCMKRMAGLLAGRNLQTINQRLFLSDDVYLRIFQELWVGVAQPRMLESITDLTAAEALGLADVLLASFEDEEFLSLGLAKLDSTRRAYQRSKETLVKQLCQLKREYSKLMLVRVDLHYGKDYIKHMVPERRILDDWKLFRTIVAKRFSSSQLGYFAKLEYGKDRSVHLHVLFLFNGRVVRQDETIGWGLKKIWEDEVTAGVGTAYSVNNREKKAAYSVLGIGVFRHLDGATIAGFQAVADYLTKPEFLTRLAMPWQKKHIFSYFLPRRSLRAYSLPSATVCVEAIPGASKSWSTQLS